MLNVFTDGSPALALALVALVVPHANERVRLVVFRQENRLWDNLCVGSLFSRSLASEDVGRPWCCAAATEDNQFFGWVLEICGVNIWDRSLC
jgi:hypothetical protein